jgi:hypothetical protein
MVLAIVPRYNPNFGHTHDDNQLRIWYNCSIL